jgi:hypothetical protein
MRLVSSKVLSALTAAHRIGQQNRMSREYWDQRFPDDAGWRYLIKNADIAMYEEETGRA